MPVARARSRLVKLILPIASTIGRASNLVMSICSTGLDRSSALRVSLTLGSISVSVVISSSNAMRAPARAGAKRRVSPITGFLPAQELLLPLHGLRTLALVGGSIKRGHRLVVDDFGAVDAEPV